MMASIKKICLRICKYWEVWKPRETVASGVLIVSAQQVSVFHPKVFCAIILVHSTVSYSYIDKKLNICLVMAFDYFPCSRLRFYKWESAKQKNPSNYKESTTFQFT